MQAHSFSRHFFSTRSIAPLRITAAFALMALLAACSNSEPANHARYGGVWEQAFSQALAEHPGKAGGE